MSVIGIARKIVTGRMALADAFRERRSVRIAVIGGKDSGKTVFLTAIANNLHAHNPWNFPLDGMRAYDLSDEIPGDECDGVKRFDYQGAKNALTNFRWPAKTAEARLLLMRLLLKDLDGRRRDREVQLEILDVPGERVADFPMLGRDYRQWCGWMEDALAGPSGCSMAYREYLAKVASAGPDDEGALFSAYRDFLADEYANFRAVTPSTVKLEIDGVPHGGRSKAEFRAGIESVPVGLRTDDGERSEFVPLPKSSFLPGSPFARLAAKYGKAYAEYAERVVRPTGRWLKGAQKLFYLVDVLTLLQAGASAWDAQKEYAEAAIGALCPRRLGTFGRMWRWAKGLVWRTQINAVYGVATKSDLVFSSANRDNMVALAEDFFGKAFARTDPSIYTDVFSCAAVRSTREVIVDAGGEKKRCLKGLLHDRRNPDAAPSCKTWVPSDVPPRKPDSSAEWMEMKSRGDFNYQYAFPGFDVSESCPPPHLGLDSLVLKMLED